MTRPIARRRFGQNFLVRRDAIDRIVAAVAACPGEPVVEIGPGRGALTAPLIVAAGRIAAVEIDRDLVAALRAAFDAERLVLIEGDVLALPLADIAAALGRPPGTRLVVAGNLPYNISKPIAMKLVRERRLVDRAVLMFQREVAQRLTAAPGDRDYGPLAILAGFAYALEAVFDLPPSAFRPKPEIVSTVTRWTPRPYDDLPDELEDRLKAVLAASFAQRRKTLRANLRRALPGGEPEAAALLDTVGLDGTRRAETFSPADFLALARAWKRGHPGFPAP